MGSECQWGVCGSFPPCGFALLDLGVVNNACYTVPSCICLHPATMRLGVFDLGSGLVVEMDWGW